MAKDKKKLIDGTDKKYQPSELPKKLTRELFFNFGVGGYEAGKISIAECSYEGFTHSQYVCLGSIIISVPVPVATETIVREKAVKSLKAQLADMQAKHWKEEKEVQDKIDCLLAIEHKKD